MLVEVLKSKIHRVTVTEADLNYIGSVTVDEDIMDAGNIIEGEKVQIVNINNGERLETYVIKGERGSGNICLNGPAARRVAPKARRAFYENISFLKFSLTIIVFLRFSLA